MRKQRRLAEAPKDSLKEYGEGNYVASRRYQEAASKFARSGKVEEAAHAAEPQSEADALQMAAAEAEGKRRAKEEDPLLLQKSPPAKKRVETPKAPRPGEPGEE